jgi:hypothetical protein
MKEYELIAFYILDSTLRRFSDIFLNSELLTSTDQK